MLHDYSLKGGLVQGDDGPWLKVQAIQEALLDGYDLVIWIDADAIVTNLAVDWRNTFPQDVVFSHDVNGINVGVLFCRNTPWMHHVLTKWEGMKARFRNQPMPEQTALAYLLYTEPKDKWHCEPQRTFNSFLYDEYDDHRGRHEGNWERGDFLLHLPGMANSRRIELLTHYLDDLKVNGHG
jgi:hypothetical protein